MEEKVKVIFGLTTSQARKDELEKPSRKEIEVRQRCFAVNSGYRTC